MSVVEDLVWLSRSLGDPTHDLAILAEGNASAIDGDNFWVKASGFQLAELDRSGLAQVSLVKAGAYLDGAELSDSETRAALQAISVGDRLPSVETFM